MEHLPKKILKISDLTFILPDDFEGNIQNALMLLAAYLNIEFKTGVIGKGNVPVKSIFDDDNSYRVNMEYGILELNDKGEYELK